jgi:hypothetical protein
MLPHETPPDEQAPSLDEEQALPQTPPELKAQASLLQILLPIVVTLGIFWWILSGIDFDSLKSAMSGIYWGEVALVIGGFCILMMVGDVFSFGAGFKWLVDPRAPWSHMLMIRSGTIFSGVIFTPLGELFAPYYFFRKWHKSVLRTVGAALFVALIDSSSGAISLAIAFIFFDTSMLSQYWLLLLIGHGALLLALAIAFSRFVLPKLPSFVKEREFFHAMRTADFFLVLKIFLVRMSVFSGACFTLFYLLQMMQIELSIAQALLFIPLFMASIFLPISAGGYGGPQGAAVLFLVQLWDLCSVEQALAFSLLWSTFFLIGRAAVSGLFILPLWRMLQGLKATD